MEFSETTDTVHPVSLRQSFQAKLTNRLKHFCAIALGVLDILNPAPCALPYLS
jgi:hypothetical protein